MIYRVVIHHIRQICHFFQMQSKKKIINSQSSIFVHSFVHSSPSIHPSIYISIYLSIYPSIYISIYLSIYPSIYISIYLYIHLSIYPSLDHQFIYLYSVTKVYNLLGVGDVAGNFGNSFCGSLDDVQKLLDCQNPIDDNDGMYITHIYY